MYSKRIVGGDYSPETVTKHSAAALVTSLLWGSFCATSIYLYGYHLASQFAFLSCITLTAGASSTFVANDRLFNAFAALMVVPSVVAMLATNGSEALGSFPVFMFYLFIRSVGKLHSRRYLQHLRSELLLKRQTVELEQASRSKTEFLATMSHEIRTPMNAVFGTTEILLGTPLDAEQKAWVLTLRDSCESLLQIISDILDLSKIEAGHVEIEQVPFALCEVIDRPLALFELVAKQKGIQLNADISDDAQDAWVVGDRNRLQQIIANLLSNALKFTKSGHVHLSCRRCNSDSSNNGDQYWVEVVVEDTGVGIPADKLDRLFKPFSQVDASTTRNYGGTGLGLAVSLQLAQLLRGHLWVVSDGGKTGQIPSDFDFESNRGQREWASRFYLRVPLGKMETPMLLEPDAADVKKLPASSLQILLCEDNLINQKIARTMLKKIGYQPEVAGNGQEAVEQCRSKEFDFVFMDLQMPLLDGLAATKLIREMPLARQPWIVALTANAFQEDHQRCLAAGMDDYLTKPLRQADLERALHNYSAVRGDKSSQNKKGP
jgi:signal transduction histidine kinase/ActR/RegA family two-component response regulator